MKKLPFDRIRAAVLGDNPQAAVDSILAEEGLTVPSGEPDRSNSVIKVEYTEPEKLYFPVKSRQMLPSFHERTFKRRTTRPTRVARRTSWLVCTTRDD